MRTHYIMSDTAQAQGSNTSAPGISGAIPSDASASPDADAGEATHTPIEKVIMAAIDSAGVANRSASVAAASTENLLVAVGELGVITKRARTVSVIVLAVSAVLLIASAGAFFTVSVQLNGRLKQVNHALTIVTKRALELGVNIEKMQRLDALVAELEVQQRADKIEKIGSRMDAALAALADLKAQLTPAAAEKPLKPVEPPSTVVLAQIRAFEAQAQAQSRQIAKLSDQIQALRVEVGKMPGLVRSIESPLARPSEKPRAPAPPAPVAVATEKREREIRPDPKGADFIQYPAPQQDASTKPR